MGIFGKIFGSYSTKELARIEPIKESVLKLEDQYAAMSDTELKAQTQNFKDRLETGENLDMILPEALATVREAADRVLGKKPFPVQLIGAIVLHQGRIAEMKTGEGKTLVACVASYLNALSGKGVHVVTVNDYLAKTQSDEMGKVLRFLGLTVGCILHGLTNEERRAAYNCDVTYATNNELGFDYLRDNMVIYAKDRVQRKPNFAIVDEVDSILIDEARTPLIISGKGDKSTELYDIVDKFVKNLVSTTVVEIDDKQDQDEINENVDYIIDEKAKTATITRSGVKKAEKYFNVDNLMDPDNMTLLHHINQALKAHGVMHVDIDYVVKDGEVIIVDEFTGRLMLGRRFNDGLHQAIEAKEGVKIANESKTLATITFQNYFRLYKKLSGMTGTAMTEEDEFREIYKLDVIAIPTNKPVIRVDHSDQVYRTEAGKFSAIIDQIVECHKKGQPVLVGTISIEKSEILSAMLKRKGIKHEVLNAKYHAKEAEIVAQAGKLGAVTIATNMAGRGTDIKLGEGVAELGGLRIIGTERHESRRIDNQLRGRSGRQGDPGESKFYLSLEDDLMRLFGSERVMSVYDTLKIPEGEEIEHKTISNFVEKAQKKIEGNNFAIRKNLLEYDRVNNEQREIIYKERRRVLDGENMHEVILKMIKDDIGAAVDQICSSESAPEEWNQVELDDMIRNIVPFAEPVTLTDEEIRKADIKELKERLINEALELYADKEKEINDPDQMREIERVILLKTIDRKWTDHIDDMDNLRQGIGLRSLGQRDPVVEYKFAGYDMFNEMTAAIREETVRLLYRIKVEQKIEREEVNKVTGTNKDDTASKGPVKKAKKIGRNDLCPCGSGLKYKNCCGKNA